MVSTIRFNNLNIILNITLRNFNFTIVKCTTTEYFWIFPRRNSTGGSSGWSNSGWSNDDAILFWNNRRCNSNCIFFFMLVKNRRRKYQGTFFFLCWRHTGDVMFLARHVFMSSYRNYLFHWHTPAWNNVLIQDALTLWHVYLVEWRNFRPNVTFMWRICHFTSSNNF